MRTGPECLEGVIPPDQLAKLRRDQTIDNKAHRFLDEPYHASRTYNLGDIEVPVLSVANLGGNTLHLRGNVMGYLEAGTSNKWLWFISGRHDLPFYLPDYVELQTSCASSRPLALSFGTSLIFELVELTPCVLPARSPRRVAQGRGRPRLAQGPERR